MPLESSIVGRCGAPLTQEIDARWTMAYAAGLGHADACYLDTHARADVLAHPLFPVCFEWPLFLAPEHLPAPDALGPGDRVRGVHATHDLVLHRPLRAGTTVTTTAKVVQVAARRSGAFQLTRLDTTDDTGAPLCTTWYGTLFRDIEVEGQDAALADELAPPLPEASKPDGDPLPVPIAANAAHVYTECARIWNPIHTDAAVARRAGLPAIILHGTATLALAVSRVVETRLGGDAERIARIGGRFGAMVAMPSVPTLRVGAPPSADRPAVGFEVRTPDGGPALRDGFVLPRS